jgi:hypothetical protein
MMAFGESLWWFRISKDQAKGSDNAKLLRWIVGRPTRVVAGPVRADALEQLWKQLASDSNEASDALETLTRIPKQSVPYLSARLRAVQPAKVEKQVGVLIAQLGDGKFAVREKATQELEKLGLEASPQLRRSLDGAISLEVRQRIDRLLAKVKNAGLTGDQKQLQGALLVLELIATVDARQVLEEMSKGGSGAWLAVEAKASLKRLDK